MRTNSTTQPTRSVAAKLTPTIYEALEASAGVSLIPIGSRLRQIVHEALVREGRLPPISDRQEVRA